MTYIRAIIMFHFDTPTDIGYKNSKISFLYNVLEQFGMHYLTFFKLRSYGFPPTVQPKWPKDHAAENWTPTNLNLLY